MLLMYGVVDIILLLRLKKEQILLYYRGEKILIEHTQFDTVYHEHFYLALFTVVRIFEAAGILGC